METGAIHNQAESVKVLAREVLPLVIEWRRHLHMNPELSYNEEMTAAFVADKLRQWGLQVKTNVGGHGVVAELKGSGTGSSCLGLRADMDALPIQEVSGRPYGSQIPAVMHACGHDAHTAILLGAAWMLSKMKDTFDGQLKFIFQPAEEKFPSGAPAMIEAGVLQNPEVQAMIALHVSPELPSGTIGLFSGPFMAAADELHFVVHGKTGHAARYREVVNPIPAAASLILKLLALSDPEGDCLLSVGKIEATGATNIIPAEARFSGTLRTFDEKKRDELHQAIMVLVAETERDYGVKIEGPGPRGYPVLINHPELTRQLETSATSLFPSNRIVYTERRFGAEDFAYYGQNIPSCLFRLGTACGSGGLHSPDFDIDETAMESGLTLLSLFTIDFINRNG